MLMLPKMQFNKLGQRYKNSDSGVAALEFALIFPILITIMYAIIEINNYTMIKRRAQMAVDLGVEFLSRDDDNSLTHLERMNALDIWDLVNSTANLAAHADGNARNTQGFSRSFAGIEFNKVDPTCEGVSCVYEPDVTWTFYWKPGASGVASPVRIKCDLTVVANSAELNGNNIQEGSLGRSAAVMGAYVVRYKPFFENGFLKEQDVRVTAVRKTRSDVALRHPGVNQC